MSAVGETQARSADEVDAIQPLSMQRFDLIASSAGRVARLRELILSLAVSGRLVRQLPGDEPAGLLLQRIKAEKDRLVPGGKRKQKKLSDTVAERDAPFVLPPSWAWSRLGEVARKVTDGTHHSPESFPSGDFKYLSAKNIKNWGVDLSDVTYVPSRVHEEIYSRCDPEYGDILYIKDGATTGVLTINPLREPFSLLSSVALIKPSSGVISEFLALVMRSPFFYRAMREGMTGVAITRVTLAKLAGALIPLPPLEEQARIVARVDELMRLCDALEAKGRLAAERRGLLLNALLRTLIHSPTSAELAVNWQRMAEHFDLVLDRPESVDVLEQAILHLAVRGLLVPQDPRDEPVELDANAVRRRRTRARGSGDDWSARGRDSQPVDVGADLLPTGWKWVELGQVAETRLGKMLDKAKNRGAPRPYLRNTNVQWRRFDLQDIKLMNLEESELDEFRLVAGDLLICEGGEPGRCAIWQGDAPEMYFQKALHRVRPRADVSAEYIAIALERDAMSGELSRYFTGATIKHFVGQALERYTFPLPPSSEQLRIVARVSELRRLCADLRRSMAAPRATHADLADLLVENPSSLISASATAKCDS